MVRLAESRHPDRLRHHPRGRGARAAPHRRAQAALQPALQVPRAGHLGQADRRGLPAAVDRARGPRRRRPLHRPVRQPRLGRGRRRRGPRGHPAAPVRPAAVPHPPGRVVRARRHGPLRRPLHRGPERPGVCRGRAGRRARPGRRLPRGGHRAAHPDGRRWPTRSGSRTPARCATGMLALVRGMARAQRIAPLAASPRDRRRPPATAGGWEVVVVRHGRLAASTVSPRGADPMPYVDAVRDSAEVVLPAPWPSPAAIPEETEKILRWLESPGRADRRPRRRVDLPGRRRRRRPGRARATGGRPARGRRLRRRVLGHGPRASPIRAHHRRR